MPSKKLEDISNSNLTRISSYLSDLYASDKIRFRLSDLATGADVSRVEAFSAVGHLIEEDILTAKVEVRCPVCDQREGIYERKSDIPDLEQSEFCGHSFDMNDDSNWVIIYQFEGELGSDFFLTSPTV